MNTKSKKGLGKGLDALLGGSRGVLEKTAVDQPVNAPANSLTQQESIPAEQERETAVVSESGIINVDIASLQPGKYQPRRVIDADSLEELANSIKAQGLMQPVVVRPVQTQSPLVKFEIIAGERRWRAVQLAGLKTLPVLVKAVDDEAAIAMALIENLQREDLNPMDEAVALSRLQKEFELTHQEVADAVGKSRAAVSNSLRLMGLHDNVKKLLENGDIDMGHARALLGLDIEKQGHAAEQVVEKRFSVRQCEAFVKALSAGRELHNNKKPPTEDPNIKALQNRLADQLGANVQVQHGANGRGKLVVSYNSLDELDGILEHIR